MIIGAVGPVVTDADRKWALALLPAWMDRGEASDDLNEGDDDGDWLDAPRKSRELRPPSGPMFVTEQAEAFERFFRGETKRYSDWSALWRKSWWPKANPVKRFPKMAPKTVYPFFRAGTKEFCRALELATPQERRIWQHVRIAQLEPNDPRLKEIRSAVTLTPTSRRMTGERP